MTGDELQALREGMRVRSEAMAERLGVTVEQYRELEDADEVPAIYSMAVRFMSDNPEDRPRIHPNDIPVLSAADIDLFGEELFDGRRWGPWRLNLASLTLDLNSRVVMVERDRDGAPIYDRREDYYITLSEVTNAKGVVDWLGQIAGKGWGPANLGHLTQALDDIFHFQGRFAHDPGFENMDAARDYLKGVIKDREDDELNRARELGGR